MSRKVKSTFKTIAKLLGFSALYALNVLMGGDTKNLVDII
jgi:hypothetical protein